MGLVSILIAGLIIALSSFYLLNDLAFKNNNSPTSNHQTPIDSAKDIQIKSDFQAIQLALNLYKVQKEKYPENLQQLSDENLYRGSLKNPYTQTDYDYEVNMGSYTLSTNLGDGKSYQISN